MKKKCANFLSRSLTKLGILNGFSVYVLVFQWIMQVGKNST